MVSDPFQVSIIEIFCKTSNLFLIVIIHCKATAQIKYPTYSIIECFFFFVIFRQDYGRNTLSKIHLTVDIPS